MKAKHWTAAWMALGVILPAATPAARAAHAEAGEGKQIVAKVEGLACPFCVYGLEKQLKKIPGVAEAHVSLGSGQAVITTKPGAQVSAAQIRDAVRRAGFKASEVKGIEESPAKPSQPGLKPGP